MLSPPRPSAFAAPPSPPPLWLLVMVTVTASISVHLFVPALPVAAAELHVSAAQVQWTISLYLFGLSVGQLVWGPMSDAWGRRKVLLAGLTLFASGSLLAAVAGNLPTLLAARAVQALGASCGMTLGRVIVSDTTRGEQTVRRLSLLGMMIMLSPGLAPLLGGVLVTSFGWRSVFFGLASLGAVALWMASTRLVETTSASGRLAPHRVLADYARLLRSRRYVALTVGAGALTTSALAFVSTAPFILTRQLHQPIDHAGLYTGLMMLGFVAGSALTSTIVLRTGSTFVIAAGTGITTIAAAGLLGVVLCGRLNLGLLFGLMLVYNAGIGMASAALMARAISQQPLLVASAAGLYGASQMGIGTLATAFAASDTNPALGSARTLLAMTLIAFACIMPALRRPG